jgi:hypothetical protein
MLSKLKSFPSFSPAGSWPNAVLSKTGAMTPLQFWMQFAEQWQKASADLMASWAKGGRTADGGGQRRR